MEVDIGEYLKLYVREIESSLAGKGYFDSSNAGVYTNSLGSTAYISFYPQEIDLTIDLTDEGEVYHLSSDLAKQEGEVILGRIIEISGSSSYLQSTLDEFFSEFLRLISSHL